MELLGLRTQKPPLGTPLRDGSALSEGLLYYATLAEGTGTVVNDVVSGLKLTVVGTPSWVPGNSTMVSSGLQLNATAKGLSATLPAWLKIQAPLTLIVGFRALGAFGAGNPLLLSLFLNNSNSAQYQAASIRCVSTTTVGLSACSNSTFGSSSTFTPTVGQDYIVVGVFNSTTYSLYVYPVNSAPLTPITGSWGYTLAATYTATALIGAGQTAASNSNINSNIYFQAVYNRALSAAEANMWGQNPWSMFRPPITIAMIQPNPNFISTTSSIYAYNSVGATVSLLGTLTPWTPGTPGTPSFSLVGGSGLTKTAQSISSSSAATITVTTGSATTPFSITDGTLTSLNSVSILTPTFAISPLNIPTNHSGHITLTLTGTGTTWVSNTFVISGVPGAVKISQNIASNTSATVVISTGSGTGTLSISDGNVSGSNTVNVLATTFTISQSSGTFKANYSITATGSTGSIWTQETASTLFSTPGTFGDSISGIVVNSDTSATFTINPATAPGGTVLNITQSVNGTTQPYTILPPTSLHIIGNYPTSGFTMATGSNNIFANCTNASFSMLLKFNSIPSGVAANLFLVAVGSLTSYPLWITIAPTLSSRILDSIAGFVQYANFTPSMSQVLHFAFSYNSSGTCTWWINGIQKATATDTHPTSNTSGTVGVGWWGGGSANANIDYQIQDLAFWNNYSLTYNDVLNLRDGIVTPQGVNSGSNPATTWYTFSGTIGNAPVVTPTLDVGLQDVQGHAGANFATQTPTATAAIAKYDSPIQYVVQANSNQYVTTSGQQIAFVFTAVPILSSVTGTVSVVLGSNAITTSATQLLFVGRQITIAGDISAGTYTVYSGISNNWLITPVYGGASNAAAVATFVNAATTNITSINSAPTIQVQFGGSGAFHTVQLGAQEWGYGSTPWVLFPLQCGSLLQAVLQNPGANYVTPIVGVSGGGGTPPTFGTPILTGGVTSFNTISGGSAYTTGLNGNSSICTIAPPAAINITGTVTNGSTTVTGVSSVTNLVPGMLVTGATAQGCTIVSILSSSSFSISAPGDVLPTSSGTSLALKVYGKQAEATATITGGAVSLQVFVPGSGYTSASPPVITITPKSGNPGSGASFTAVVTQVIGYIPMTSPGSNMTGTPTLTITDAGGGTGAIVQSLMTGVGASDVLRFTASDNWITCAAGPTNEKTNAPITNYVGQNPPGFGQYLGLNIPRSQQTIGIGMGLTPQTSYPFTLGMTNWLKRWNQQTGGGSSNAGGLTGTVPVTIDPGNRPVTIKGTSTNPTILHAIAFTQTTGLDNSGSATPWASGANNNFWMFTADEWNPGANRMVFKLLCDTGTCTPYPSGEGYTAGTPATGVTSITLNAGGSNYYSVPTVTLVGGGGTGALAHAVINANGQLVYLSLDAVGSGYTSAPTVVISGGGGSGASGTAAIGAVLVGSQWLFTMNQNSTNFCGSISCAVWSISQLTPPAQPYNYTLTNERLFGPESVAPVYPAQPSNLTSNGFPPPWKTWFTSSTNKYPSVLRMMDCFISNDLRQSSNLVDPSDLRDPADFSFNSPQTYTSGSSPVSLTQNPTGSRFVNITNFRTYSLSNTGIAAINVTARGSGYIGTIPLAFSGGGGSFATGYATVTNGVITSATVTFGGSNYASAPAVTAPTAGSSQPNFYGATGGGAVFTATVVNGAVTAVAVNNGGSAYTSLLPITITDSGGGTGAVAFAVVSTTGTINGGAIASMNVTNGGSGYTAATTVTIAGVTSPTINIVGGVIVSLWPVQNGLGSGLTSPPAVVIADTGGGTGAVANTTLNGAEVTTSGSNYTGATTASIVGNPGTGATFSVTIGYPTGLGGVIPNNVGAGYTSAPTVTISDVGGGSGAVVTANYAASTGTITSYNVLKPGSGYVSPVATLSGGGSPSTPATATAIPWTLTSNPNAPASSPNLYWNNPGTGSSTVVSPDPTWTGYGAASPTSGGPYILQPKTVGFLNPDSVPHYGEYCCEAVCSTPHNIKSGQTVILKQNSGQVFMALGIEGSAVKNIANTVTAWVTGPYTFVFFDTGSNSDGTGLPGHFCNIAGNYSVNYTCQIIAPNSNQLPYITAAQQAGSLPGTDFWVNITQAQTDACVAVVAAQIRDNFPIGRNVFVEYGNEHFNNANIFFDFCPSMGKLGIWSNQNLNADQSYCERAHQIHNIFVNTFNQPDINGNINRGGEIVRLFGSFYQGTAVTQAIVGYTNANAIPVGAIAVADYEDVASTGTSPTAACTVSVSGSGGTLPAGNYYAAYTWTDPVSGKETNLGASRSAVFSVTLGQEPVVTIPTLPTWGTPTINLYLTQANGAAGTETLYQSNITSPYTITSSFSPGVSPPTQNQMYSVSLLAAQTATHWPTSIAYQSTTPYSRTKYLEILTHSFTYDSYDLNIFSVHQGYLNQYSVGNNPLPALVGYEGSVELLVPNNVQTTYDPQGILLQTQLTADISIDPAIYNMQAAYFLLCQAGGLSYLNIYNIGGSQYQNGYQTWSMMNYANQPIGRGDGSIASNGIAVKNQSWTDNQFAPFSLSTSPRMQAWNDWLIGTGSAPPTNYVAVLSGPTTGVIGQALVFTLTFNSLYTGVIIPVDSSGNGVFFPEFLSWNNSAQTQQFTYVPGSVGSRTISVVSSPLISIGGNSATLTISPPPASSLVLTGPAPTSYLGAVSVSVGVPSGLFTVTPNGLYTGTVTLSDSDRTIFLINNGTFNPTSLVFSNSNAPQTFTYTANTAGTKLISAKAIGLTSSNPIYVYAR